MHERRADGDSAEADSEDRNPLAADLLEDEVGSRLDDDIEDVEDLRDEGGECQR